MLTFAGSPTAQAGVEWGTGRAASAGVAPTLGLFAASKTHSNIYSCEKTARVRILGRDDVLTRSGWP